ncbi:MAG: hypothetical protein OS112_00870 [Methanoregula sp.]|nr:MAG: hypothetical protein OS112_00870 [Methanoregula sp.]
MVNHDGQLYTIEGVAAGLIMLLTAFIVVGTTSVYTPGDTHISDMQLEQLGSDGLHMMNTPNTSAASSESALQTMIKNNERDRFKETFLSFCNTTGGGTNDHLQFSADVYYRDTLTNSVNLYHFTESRKPTGGEHAVRVTEWVKMNGGGGPLPIDNRVQAVLMEVLVWRD